MRNDHRWEASIKVEIPDFSGTLMAEEFIDWLNTVERVFEFKDAPENRKVKWVAIKLKGRASAWWEQLQLMRERRGKQKIVSWDKMKKKLQENFPSYSEEQLVSRYLGGLRQSIQDVLCLYTFWTVSEVYQRALAIEKQQTRFGNRTGGSQNKFAGPKQAEHGAKSQESNIGMSKRPTTMRGRGLGDPTSSSNKTFKCFKKMKAKVMDYEDEEEYTFEPSYDEYDENNEDNFVYGDTGQIGSCENVISQDAVEKLNLKQEKLLKPCKLSWFKKGNEVNVDTRCLVSFSIGRKYIDNVWCDVVSMDACHVLLGRPWQFDRCTTHDGRSNTYSFNKDNVKVTLVPSKVVGLAKPTKKNNEILLSINNFMDEVDESGIMYALVVRDEEPLVSVPQFVKPLIEKYVDVMPKELPSRLPPIRDIQHHIDLIPGSSLHNKPAYRMSPKEHEELQRHVEEALEKGLIRESMSPCALPTLLTPKKDGTSLIAPITECMKGGLKFYWTSKASESFELIKKKMSEAPVLVLPILERRGKVYNWETAKYGKIWYDEDVHDIRSVEPEFPVIVFDDKLTFEEALSCEPTVSPLNDNEIDFRISFDESNDEDYTVIYDKNSFSYKIIYVNDLKTESENDNEKVNMPSFSSPEPMVSCFDDLDFFNDFENEFPAIVYNDALTSKSDFSTEPVVIPQHIDEFNLKDETSLFECDKEEQNVLYFNDIFPFNVIYPDDSKSDKDNDKIDIKQPLGDNVINTDVGAYAQGSNKLLEM
ncbi:putative CCCH-type zinc finger family protein, partial [Tanacetum coccineum]